jgi:flagellar basal-body rod protein FlgF
MKVVMHVSVAGQLALQKRLDAIAANVANITTPGYRAEGERFSEVLSRQQPTDVSFVSSGHTYIDRRPGGLMKTGNPLDVAVKGDVWLAVQGPAGPVYTRDGRLAMLPTGELVSAATGWPVLDVGGAPITLNPAAGPPQIARDGMITQGGRQMGAIGLFRIPPEARLQRHGNSGVVPDREPEPVVNFRDAGVLQGYIEQSNVNGALEMVRLIEATNAFKRLASALDMTERTVLDAIRTLGGETGA